MKFFEPKIGIVTIYKEDDRAIGFLLQVDKLSYDVKSHSNLLDFVWKYGEFTYWTVQ